MNDGGVCRTAPARKGLAFKGMKLGHITYDCWSYSIITYLERPFVQQNCRNLELGNYIQLKAAREPGEGGRLQHCNNGDVLECFPCGVPWGQPLQSLNPSSPQ